MRFGDHVEERLCECRAPHLLADQQPQRELGLALDEGTQRLKMRGRVHDATGEVHYALVALSLGLEASPR